MAYTGRYGRGTRARRPHVSAMAPQLARSLPMHTKGERRRGSVAGMQHGGHAAMPIRRDGSDLLARGGGGHCGGDGAALEVRAARTGSRTFAARTTRSCADMLGSAQRSPIEIS